MDGKGREGKEGRGRRRDGRGIGRDREGPPGTCLHPLTS